MPDHGLRAIEAQGAYQGEGVAYHAEQPEALPVAVVVGIPPGRATVAALVGCHHMKTGLRQRTHYVPPAEPQLREAMQEQQQRGPGSVESRFEEMRPETGARCYESGSYPRRQMLMAQGGRQVREMVDRVLSHVKP